MPLRFGIVAFAFALLCAAEEPAILRPTDHAAMPETPFRVVARGKPLLDGKPFDSSQPIKPAPGLHELTLGSEVVKFFVGSPAPAGFKPFRVHPPAAACDACHAASTGGGDLKANACFACHNEKAFPKTHMHNPQVLEDCASCHSPHGSAESFHLKLPKALACKLCHG